VRESREFPGSEVCGEKQNAFAACVGALEVFKAFIDDYARDILARVTGKEAEFGELASEGYELAAKQPATVALRHFREDQSQVTQAYATQAPMNGIDG
jgi:hypothetical protein